MSMTRDRGNINFECEECHETLETETKAWSEAFEKLKEAAWRWLRIGDTEHAHFCTELCKQTWAQRQRRV